MTRSERVILTVLFLAIALARFGHLGVLWVEEAYPTAAAQQILAGKFLYRDIWFDKPPLYALVYLLWDAQIDWPLRWAGALFAALACSLAFRFALDRFGRREAVFAAVLTGFPLTFGIPAAVMALAPDLLMVVPHVAAVFLAWKKRPLWSGVFAAVAFLVNAKGALAAAACLLWIGLQGMVPFLAGFLGPNLFFWSVLYANDAVGAYWQQVWTWGDIYARDTFLTHPILEGLKRTGNWAGFHATLVLGAAWYLWRERDWRTGLWILFSLAGVIAGWRFFPRYYFQLLPPLAIAGARGLALMPGKARIPVLCLLLIPVARFGPRSAVLLSDLLQGHPHQWSDLALNEDSKRAGALVKAAAKPGDTLLVWGYRPDVFVYAGLPAGTRYLDSQPLTGVIADRHLISSHVSAGALAAQERDRLAHTAPSFLVDGLGPINPQLSPARFPDLQDWFAHYQEIGRTGQSIIYRRIR